MRKGFTLVELLAVIVILAIILAIAIPGISNIIESAKKGAAESNAKMLLKAIEYKMLADETYDPTIIDETNVATELGVDASNYERLTVKKMNGQVYITMVGKDKWNGITISGTKGDTRLDETITEAVEVANAPMIATGMIPVKWYENGTEKYWVTTTEDDPDWYEYGITTATRRWANAVTVNATVTGSGTGTDNLPRHDRSWYQSQPSGTPISISDINIMWVWIPRYVYRIRPAQNGQGQDIANTGWHKSTAGIIDVQFSKGVDDNWNKSVIGAIDLGETANASNNKWTNHPAFTFGNTELKGFWFAKFEANNDGSNNVKIVPNVASWRGASVNTIFTKVRGMETNNMYGWGNTGNGIDTHLMKNTEWGAVTYLAKSIYGKNDEIWINPSDSYTTGCAGDNVNAGITSGCAYAYETPNGVQASTTGNTYGIYDLSGNTREYVAAYVNNTHDTLTTNASNLVNAEAKYKNVYYIGTTDTDVNNYASIISSKGDALYETSSGGSGNNAWYSDRSYMVRTDMPVVTRGGYYGWGVNVGAFYFDRYGGGGYTYCSFRPVLIVDSGL